MTTLTKKMAEDLTDYLQDIGIRVRYIHADIDTIERSEIIRELRKGTFDVLVGINLLREGLDLPEVSLVAILDADKEGYLRSERSLIQTIGRAARNVHGTVLMYADTVTDSMRKAIDETNRRRDGAGGVQRGARHHAADDPQGDQRSAGGGVRGRLRDRRRSTARRWRRTRRPIPRRSPKRIAALRGEMRDAARQLEFERAASLRDEIRGLEERLLGVQVPRGRAGLTRRAGRPHAPASRPGPARIGAACRASDGVADPTGACRSERSRSASRPCRPARACTC